MHTRESITLRRTAHGVVLAALLLACSAMAGCAGVQSAAQWAFFPNQKAAAERYESQRAELIADYESERAEDEAEAERLIDQAAQAREAEREKLAEIEMQRVDLTREFAKLEIDYNADLSQLDLRRDFASHRTADRLAAIDRDLSAMQERMAERSREWGERLVRFDRDQTERMERAASSDQMLWGLVTGGLGLISGGGLGVGVMLKNLRRKLAESRRLGAETVWQSIDAGMEADPELKARIRGSEQLGRIMTSVLAQDPVVLEMANEKKVKRKVGEAA